MPSSTCVSMREFARMIGRSHSWVVSQCQRNIIPKTTDGKIPVDDALKIVAQLDDNTWRQILLCIKSH